MPTYTKGRNCMERIIERYELAFRALTKFHELASRQNLTEIGEDTLVIDCGELRKINKMIEVADDAS